ncbi:Pleckstrin homology domain-containing protein [Cladorrhinum sp. PSN259]|nr:Pleckstrin homology domain-containing protein [Cladorrhinum sp. PSN259]
MADTQKPVEVAPVAEPVVETKPAETAATEATEVAAAPAVEATPAAATEEVAVATEEKAEEKKEEEVKPVEEGHLEHKGQGANFPKNLIYSKTLFWFGSEPVDVKAIPTFKADKVADVAHHVTSWAAETGKGLLFYSEKGDKAAPHGAIQLAEATEPVTDGTNKFHFTAKGHKHAFKAPTAAERDNWVAQLKLKIAEAKELAATITESETYKKTLESLKPAPVKKEEKAAEPVAETVTATEEAAAPAEATEAAVVTEAPKEEAAEETKEEDKLAEEPKKEEAKPRSASRKRTSIFGSLLGGKKEEKKPVEAAETKTAEAEATPAVETAAPVETAAVEVPATTEVAPAVEAAETTTEAAEAKPEETAEEKKEEAAAAPKPVKRQSLFGNLSFGKKKAAAPAESAVKETPAPTEAVAETAPVIPAVETTEPLSAEVSSPATVPTETVEIAPAVSNGETKEVKAEKRKSSLPFSFGKKKESTTSDEEGEKPKSPSAFSKLRATIKGKKTEKVEEKPEEVPAVPAVDAAAETPAVATEEVAAAETTEVAPVEVAAPAATEEEKKPLETTPVVAATA